MAMMGDNGDSVVIGIDYVCIMFALFERLMQIRVSLFQCVLRVFYVYPSLDELDLVEMIETRLGYCCIGGAFAWDTVVSQLSAEGQ
jgi:hypothetical protein